MDRPRGRVALAQYALVTLVIVGCTTGKPPAPVVHVPAVSDVPAADARAIDALFRSYDAPGVPGAAIVVIKNGRVAFMRGYGLADIETKIPVTERTNFRLASLTKAFTAMAVLLLVHDGRLQLDDRVRNVLPGFPAYGSAIEIRHLLSHTSGLRGYQALMANGGTRQIRDRDVLALLQRASSAQFPPGSGFRYGDSGYAILALVVEHLSGTSFARFLRDRIFVPVGMESTVAYDPAVSGVPNRAVGYSMARHGFRPSDQSSTSAVLGDGGIYSSVHDLVAWDRALDHHALVDRALQQFMWTPGMLNDGTRTRYGFGWFLERDATGFHVFHRGETSGFTNFILKYPDRRLTVVILTNRRGGAPADIAATIAALPSFRTAP